VSVAFITAEKAQFPVRRLCQCLGVTRSGYYAWQARGPSRRQQRDAQLTRQLRVLHADSRQTYGRPDCSTPYAPAAWRSAVNGWRG